MDAVDGANFGAGCVLRVDTGFGDDVRHSLGRELRAGVLLWRRELTPLSSEFVAEILSLLAPPVLFLVGFHELDAIGTL